MYCDIGYRDIPRCLPCVEIVNIHREMFIYVYVNIHGEILEIYILYVNIHREMFIYV